MRKHGLRIIGLALMAALGLMAFTAVAAQAETLELRLYHLALLQENKNFRANGVSEELIGAQESEIRLKVPAKKYEIRCATAKVLKGTHIENVPDAAEGGREKSPSEKSAEGKGEIQFESCTIFVENTTTKVYEKSEPCTKAFNEAEHNNGGKPIAVFDFLFLLHSHVSTPLNSHFWFAVFRSLPEVSFMTLKFGGTCSLPKETKITGKVAAELPAPAVETDAAKLKAVFESETGNGKTLNELPNVEAKLLYGESPAFLVGKGYAELAGAEAGKAWGVM
jgi:hypothetical protein